MTSKKGQEETIHKISGAEEEERKFVDGGKFESHSLCLLFILQEPTVTVF